jgi:hypothetical protein
MMGGRIRTFGVLSELSEGVAAPVAVLGWWRTEVQFLTVSIGLMAEIGRPLQ